MGFEMLCRTTTKSTRLRTSRRVRSSGNGAADVLITDLRLGGEDRMELMEKAQKLPKPPICIMMTAYGSVDTAVEAMKRGAYDFVTKPVNIDRLEMLIQRAARAETRRENVSNFASRSADGRAWKDDRPFSGDG